MYIYSGFFKERDVVDECQEYESLNEETKEKIVCFFIKYIREWMKDKGASYRTFAYGLGIEPYGKLNDCGGLSFCNMLTEINDFLYSNKDR